jgi:hypothetical protein
MFFFDGVFGLVMFGMWIFCLIDVITTPEERCRNLPKIAWVLIVLFFLDIGSIVWLIAGRSWEPRGGPVSVPRASRATPPTSPDDDEQFLAGLRARAEEQRRRAREQRHDDQDPGAVG